MVRDAEADSGPVLAEEDDARVTRVGRFLRRFRIDELPQLVNILKGEMSFVGPRPERPHFVEQYMSTQGYGERFNIRPGVTGLAQVNGSYATTPERKLKYDLIYMYHQNLAMDAQIVLETLQGRADRTRSRDESDAWTDRAVTGSRGGRSSPRSSSCRWR